MRKKERKERETAYVCEHIKGRSRESKTISVRERERKSIRERITKRKKDEK